MRTAGVGAWAVLVGMGVFAGVGCTPWPTSPPSGEDAGTVDIGAVDVGMPDTAVMDADVNGRDVIDAGGVGTDVIDAGVNDVDAMGMDVVDAVVADVTCQAGQSNCGGVCRVTGATCSSAGTGGCAQTGTVVCSGTTTVCSATPRTSGTCTTPAGGECNESADCVCLPGRRDCGGTCVDTSTDVTNCGACGNRCTASQRCASGACVQLMCPSGMALIPAGNFHMGADGVSMVTLSAFCMDSTEVTVAAYRMCPTSICGAPSTSDACNWTSTPGARENHPINCVDWYQATAYCRWRGGDLPTEAQWEYAARGTDGRTYPWGPEAPSSQLCWSGMAVRSSTCEVGYSDSHFGNSPFGLQDMAGNVWEWVQDRYAMSGPQSENYVYRGGSWDDTDPDRVQATHRNGGLPGYRGGYLGFRCAHNPI